MRMSPVTDINETCKWVVSYVIKSCHAYECIMSRNNTGQGVISWRMYYVTYVHESCHVWLSHVMHMNASCHRDTWDNVSSHNESVMSRICISHVTYGWVRSHIWMHYITNKQGSIWNPTINLPCAWVMSHMWCCEGDCLYMYMYMYKCARKSVYIYMYVYIYVYMYVYIYIYIFTYVHVYIYICIYMCL